VPLQQSVSDPQAVLSSKQPFAGVAQVPEGSQTALQQSESAPQAEPSAAQVTSPWDPVPPLWVPPLPVPPLPQAMAKSAETARRGIALRKERM
jgi:hypothetical protein